MIDYSVWVGGVSFLLAQFLQKTDLHPFRVEGEPPTVECVQLPNKKAVRVILVFDVVPK